MMLNPETLDAFKAQYRPKLAVLLCVWLITYRSVHLALPPDVTTTSPSTLTPQRDAIRMRSPGAVTVGSTLLSHGNEDFPLTAPYRAGDPRPKVKTPDVIQVKGSTTASILEALVGGRIGSTPPLSEPPPPRHTQQTAASPSSGSASGQPPDPSSSEREITTSDPQSKSESNEECPIDFRGRPMCPDTTRTPASIRQRSSELADAASEFGVWVLGAAQALAWSLMRVRLSPFTLFVGIMHLLLAVQLVALATEDHIVRTAMSNPLPPDFARADTLSKRLVRLKWRLRATFLHHMKPIAVLLACIVTVTLVAEEAWTDEGAGVPFGSWLLPQRDDAEGSASDSTASCGYRSIVLLETLAAFVSLVQPIKHLLPASILSPTIAPPPYLFPAVELPHPSSSSRNGKQFRQRASPSVQSSIEPISLETAWLLSHIVEAALSLITLVQIACITPSIGTWSPLSLTPHLLFHTVRGRLAHISSVRHGMLRTYDCLRTVFASFPDREEGSSSVGQLRPSRPRSDSSEWICVVCFEGDAVPSTPNCVVSSDDEDFVSLAPKTTSARCSLPCGHTYHAGCLVHWLHFQSWCPVCHASVVPIRPPSPAPALDPDVYPGNLRRRRVM